MLSMAIVVAVLCNKAGDKDLGSLSNVAEHVERVRRGECSVLEFKI